ncbi:MAG: molybdopterin-binding protein [Bacilli bacterium]
MKKVRVEDAIGLPLLHDITGTNDHHYSVKKTIFKKGHIIQAEDIQYLKQSGKNNIYISSKNEDYIHEDECAQLFTTKLDSNSFYYDGISEGKVNVFAIKCGVFVINETNFHYLNSKYKITLASKANYIYVEEGELVASFRIIDLYYEKQSFMQLLDDIDQLLSIHSLTNKSISLLTVGNEIYDNKIQDLSLAKLNSKLVKYQLSISKQIFLKDSLEDIAFSLQVEAQYQDIIFVTGGMSVDPDDVSKDAIFSLTNKIICDHTPYLPGSMFNLSIINQALIIGCPANVIFSKETILDILLPRLLIGHYPTTKEIMELGIGCL